MLQQGRPVDDWTTHRRLQSVEIWQIVLVDVCTRADQGLAWLLVSTSVAIGGSTYELYFFISGGGDWWHQSSVGFRLSHWEYCRKNIDVV